MTKHIRVAVTAAALGLSVFTGACARQVEVRTGETPTAAGTSLSVTNNLAQAVNVYVRPNTGAGEIFVRQVAAKSTETLSVRGVAAGTAVTLRAAPVDGSVNYTRENVTLGSGFSWTLP
jgi:hypothetical protein